MAKHKTAPTPIQVDIVSDIVCPWCWLGTRYFHQAVQTSGADISVTWRPYMLDPTVPSEGMPYKAYMKAKFGDGPSDRFKSMREHLIQAAPEAGITFNFSDIPMRPNTLNAHRLIKWAQGQDKANAASEALFNAFFKDLKDIGNPSVLTEIAQDIGLDPDVVSNLLTGDQDKASIQQEIQFFKGLGISGVPTFIYNGQSVVQGAQPPEHHLKALAQAKTLTAS